MIERFELELIEVRYGRGSVSVPVVDGWVELQHGAQRAPLADERRAFAAALGELVRDLRRSQPALRWYFLHKPPGLKLRFAWAERPRAGDLARLLDTCLGWDFAWLSGLAVGSVFDQAELMPRPYRGDVAALLTRAADRSIEALLAGRHCSCAQWADFVIALLRRFGLDDWLIYEAIARLRRLRSAALTPVAASDRPLLDPRAMLQDAEPAVTPGFESSVALLQGLNLLLNVWAIDAPSQVDVFDRVCSRTRPELLDPPLPEPR